MNGSEWEDEKKKTNKRVGVKSTLKLFSRCPQTVYMTLCVSID